MVYKLWNPACGERGENQSLEADNFFVAGYTRVILSNLDTDSNIVT